METLQPLINLLVLLTALSVAAERVTNILKLRSDVKPVTGAAPTGRARDFGITGKAVAVGIALAVLMKANFFEILTHLESPWQTLGWVQVTDSHWIRTEATANLGTFLYALVGSVFTGVALGFGSKFWHDVLGAVFEIRGLVRKFREQPAGGGANADR